MNHPSIRTSRRCGLLALLCLPLLSSCSLLVSDEVGGLEEDSSANGDLTLELRGFNLHVEEYFEVTLVGAGNTVISRAIYDPLPASATDVFMEAALPFEEANRIDFYADHNGNGSYDRPPTDGSAPLDHSWRIPIGADHEFHVIERFQHVANFNDIADPLGRSGGTRFELHIGDAIAAEGSTVEATVYVVDEDMNIVRQVGFYHLGTATGADIEMSIEGIIDGGPHIVDILFDDEELCTISATATAGGLSVERRLDDLICETLPASDGP